MCDYLKMKSGVFFCFSDDIVIVVINDCRIDFNLIYLYACLWRIQVMINRMTFIIVRLFSHHFQFIYLATNNHNHIPLRPPPTSSSSSSTTSTLSNQPIGSTNAPPPPPSSSSSLSTLKSTNNIRKDKTTRMRTVLNEKQLLTLRTCYGANPRPDASMKEQLVEMTQLSPRVIRVWFQNKRTNQSRKSSSEMKHFFL